MKLTGAELIVRYLEHRGVDMVAGIPGGATLPLYDALYHSRVRHILARHEQGAGFIAHGMARSTGKTAVCTATSGPGATNLITALADARLDSVPLVAITGQVAMPLIGTDAFQEVDTQGLSIPVTKHTFLVRTPEELARALPEAFAIAERGRPGPVVIDVPRDVQAKSFDFPGFAPDASPPRLPCPDESAIDQIAEMINRSERPVIYAGGGIVASGASGALAMLARRGSIPVALTLMGLGCFPPDDPLCLGMLGMHANLSTNLALAESDLLIAIGVRFDDRATGEVREFCRHAAVIHIDIDRSEIDKIRKSNVALIADAGMALESLLPRIEPQSRSAWRERVAHLRALHEPDNRGDDDPFHPERVLRHLAKSAPEGVIVATDVGQHQMWAARSFPVSRPRSFLTSGGLGTMGFGLPAAIGAALANPGRKVICVSGDGSFMMNMQELATLADHRADVTVIVMNNGGLGLVRQQQQLFYGGRFSASSFATSPNFPALAQSFGVRALNLSGVSDPSGAISLAMRDRGPLLIDLPVARTLNALPMVPPGKSNVEMITGGAHEKRHH